MKKGILMELEKNAQNYVNSGVQFEMLIDNAMKNLNGLKGDFKLLLDVAIAARQTLDENLHLADGDNCTLKDLRDAYLKIDPNWDKEQGE